MSKVTIKAPNTEYTGISAGVAFTAGIAQVDATDERRIAWFEENGYTVELPSSTAFESKPTDTEKK